MGQQHDPGFGSFFPKARLSWWDRGCALPGMQGFWAACKQAAPSQRGQILVQCPHSNHSQSIYQAGWLTPHPLSLLSLLLSLLETGPSLLPTLLAHYAHTCATPKLWHHLQIPASPSNTGITPKYQHHPQTPASPPNTCLTLKQQHHPRGPIQVADALEVLCNGSAQARAAQVNFLSPISSCPLRMSPLGMSISDGP